MIGLSVGVLLEVVVCGNAIEEGAPRRAAVHAASLMGPLGVVGDEVGIESGLHLIDGLEPGPASFDAEVLVEQGAVELLDDAENETEDSAVACWMKNNLDRSDPRYWGEILFLSVKLV